MINEFLSLYLIQHLRLFLAQHANDLFQPHILRPSLLILPLYLLVLLLDLPALPPHLLYLDLPPLIRLTYLGDVHLYLFVASFKHSYLVEQLSLTLVALKVLLVLPVHPEAQHGQLSLMGRLRSLELRAELLDARLPQGALLSQNVKVPELEDLQFLQFSDLPQRATLEKVLLVLGASTLRFDCAHYKGLVEGGICLIEARSIA